MRLTLLVLLVLFIGFNKNFAQSSIPAAQKQKMLQDMLREKIHSGIAAEEENDIAPLLRTTAGTIDKKITVNASASSSEGETSIAVDPADSNNLVISFMQQPGLTFPIYYSGNAGQSWIKSTFNAQSVAAADFPGTTIIGGGDPAFAWDKNGTVYFAWIYLTLNATSDTSSFTLNWAYSTDKGHTWKVQPGEDHFIGQAKINPTTGTDFGYKDGICDREWLAVDNSGGPRQGTLYCSFINFNIGGESVKAKAPAATSFGSIHRAYSGSSQFGNIEVDKNGILHMSFADVGINTINHVSSANGGLTFTAPHTLYTGNNLWGQSGIVHGRENAAPSLAIDGKNNLHLVWSDYNGTVTSFYSISTDGGLNWTNPIPLDGLSTSFSGNQTFMPTVAAAANSVTISLTAIDNNDSARYYQLSSTNNGQTFGNWPVLLSSLPTNYQQYLGNPNIFFGDYNRSVSTTCKTYAIWEDGRKTQGPKVYIAATDHCTTAVRELTAIAASIQLQSLYPNPATNNCNLQLTGSKEEAVTITVLDITGKAVLEQQYNIHNGTQTIRIPFNLNSGTYLISLSNKEGLIATRNLQVVK